MLGYSADELKTKTFWDITPEKWRKDELEAQGVELLQQDYSELYEKELIRKDGSVFPVEVRAYMLERAEDIESCKIGSFVRDITNRKRSEEERERLMQAIEQAAETIMITDSEGTIHILYEDSAGDLNHVSGCPY